MRVEVRVLGDRAGSLEARSIPDPSTATPAAAHAADPTGDPTRTAQAASHAPPGTTVPLRTLIDHVVRTEVAAFGDRERQRRFVRLLTPDELATGAAAGKVDPGGGAGTRPVDPGGRTGAHPVDPDQAAATALEAFDDGLFLVVVDGEQVTALDAPVTLRPETLVRFVRLTALAGG